MAYGCINHLAELGALSGFLIPGTWELASALRKTFFDLDLMLTRKS
jgi:hypothetical protein